MKLEEKATNFETMRHIERVRNLLNCVISEMIRRGEEHDQSKLESPEVELFTEFTPKLAGLTYGSAEFNECKVKMGPALIHHYARNPHHPEFYAIKEQWKPVVGYEEYFIISDHGRIKSLSREISYGINKSNCIKPECYLKGSLTEKGYVRTQLAVNGETKNYFNHRLVASAFLENPENKPQINHKNGIKHDNRVENLEWATASENQLHAYETSLKKPTVKYLVKCVTLDIITEGCNKMEDELKKRGYLHASASAISRCINEENAKHLDLEFEGYHIQDFGDVSFINDMNLFDIIEMLVDWKASSERHNDGNLLKSIAINSDRFGINHQLTQILENTAKALENK